MALLSSASPVTLLLTTTTTTPPPPLRNPRPLLLKRFPSPDASTTLLHRGPLPRRRPAELTFPPLRAIGGGGGGVVSAGLEMARTGFQVALDAIRASPPTWGSAALSNAVIFVLGCPLLFAGLSWSGIAAAFLLGTLTWRAFGGSGFFLVASYFVLGTAATKLKIAQKEAEGVAEKRRGRRGPGSVIGSSAAGCACALLSIFGVGGEAFSRLWVLGFVASFCTKLSDTVSSEIGKAYGKITYLVTNFKVVPRGTEGAVSLEGTIAGVLAASLLAGIAYLIGEINALGTVICIVASQIANLGESFIGASLQDRDGFQWLNNDVVNVINISIGSILAIIMQQLLLHS